MGIQWNFYIISLLIILNSIICRIDKTIVLDNIQRGMSAKHLHQMFIVWSTELDDHWAGRHYRQFQMRDSKETKSLILPSVGSQRKDNRWATPKNTGTIVASVSSSRIVLNCYNTKHSLLKYLYQNALLIL